jgi:hypothetical protein
MVEEIPMLKVKRWQLLALSLLVIFGMMFTLLPLPIPFGGAGVAEATTITDNLVGYWKLDESSGNAADALGTNTLVNTNTATYEAGRINNAVLTNPSGNKYLKKANPTGLPTGSGSATINFWAKPRVVSVDAWGSGVTWGAEGSHQMCGLGIRNTGMEFLNWGDDLAQTYAYPVGSWTMFSVTVNGATKKVNFYANGEHIGTEQTLANTPNVGTAFVCIGAQRPGNLVCFDGDIDEVGIWSRILTSNELWQLYNFGDGLPYPLSSPSTGVTRHFLDGCYTPGFAYLEPTALVTDTGQIDLWLTSAKYTYSTDGVTWAALSSLVFTGGPAFTVKVGGHVLKEGSTWYYYASNYMDPTTPRICVYTSTDKINFTYQATCITGGAAGDNDKTGIANMFVWKEGPDDWRMLYESNDSATSNFSHICYATATSPTQSGWTKYQVDGHTVGVINQDWTGNPEMPRTGGNTIVKKINGDFVVYVQQFLVTTDGMSTPVGRYSSPDCITWTYDGPVRWTYTHNPTWAVGQVPGTNWSSGDEALCEFQGHSYLFTGTTEQLSFSYLVYQVDNHTLAELNEMLPSTYSLTSSFTYKRPVYLNTSATGANVTTDQANFPLVIEIDTAAGWGTAELTTFFNDTYNPNGKRIQIFDSDYATSPTANLVYEVGLYNTTSQTALYYVKKPTVTGNLTGNSTNNNYVWVAYGNDPNIANMDNPYGVWDANFKNVYHFASSTTADSTANFRALSSYGTISVVAGQVGNAVSATWSNTVYLSGITFAPGTGAYTTETFFLRNGAPSGDYVPTAIAIGNGIGGGSIPRVSMGITKTTGLLTIVDSDGTASWVIGTTAVCDNAWHYLSTTRTGTTLTVYVDSASDGSATQTARNVSTSSILLGRDGNNAYDFLGGGTLDEVRISNTARSADWLKLTYYSMKKTSFNGDNGVSAPFLSWGAQITTAPDISNTPSSWSVGVVQPSQTYWANGAEPGWPLSTSDCWGNLTNNSSFAVDISASMTNMIGGTTWTIGSSPDTNIFTIKIGVAGLAGVGNFTTLSNTPVAWITNMAVGNMTRWTMVFYTPTNSPQFADGVPKSGNMTLTAEAS